ncbi:hypothetical protein GJAV_G00029580 [Gymnothorax javanicus]|nr:hypothetical protein GJAV_G00029580 [Gymnothorax javanicus]
MIILQIDAKSPLLFVDMSEDEMDYLPSKEQQSKVGKKEKKHKKKRREKHVTESADAMLDTAEGKIAEQEQELGIDQEQRREWELDKNERKAAKKQKKRRDQDCDLSLGVVGKVKRKKQMGHAQEVNELQTLLQEEVISQERKKRKSSRDRTDLIAWCETVAAEDGSEVSRLEEGVSELTPIEVSQPRRKKKKKKKKEKNADLRESGIHGETEDGVDTSLQGEWIPQKKKRKKRKHRCYQTELNTHSGIEDGTEASQQEEVISEQILPETNKNKSRESSRAQTEFNISSETEDGTKDDSKTSLQSKTIPQEMRGKKRKIKSGKADLSIQGEIVEGNRSSQYEQEIPLVKKRRKNGRSEQTELSVQVETVAGVKDNAKVSRKEKLSELIPQKRTRTKSLRRRGNQKRLAELMNDETLEEVISDELDSHGLNYEQWDQHWQAEKMEYIEELKEFIPRIEKRTPNEIYRVIKYDLQRFRTFKKAGVGLRHGRYHTEEVERLKKNVEDFLVLTGIDSATKLFFPSRFPEEKTNIIETKNKYKFHLRVSEGICRPWHDVYNKGRKMYDNCKMGRFTDEELHSLQKLHQLHGNKWMKIAELTGRSSHALEKRLSQQSLNKGSWTEDELQRLEGALKDHLLTLAAPGAGGASVSRDQLYSKLPWTEVAQKVSTRSWDKCRAKWMAILKKRMYSEEPGGSLPNKIRLIKALYGLEIEDAADINWEDLTKIFGDVTPHFFLQTRFYQMKVRWVPQWRTLSFGEIIDFLHEKVLPQLEEKVHISSDTEQETTQQERFLLSEIFDHAQ